MLEVQIHISVAAIDDSDVHCDGVDAFGKIDGNNLPDISLQMIGNSFSNSKAPLPQNSGGNGAVAFNNCGTIW